MDFASTLRKARKKAGITQKALANELNVTPAMIAQYETGKRKPRKDTLAKIAEALHVGYGYTKVGEPYLYDFKDVVAFSQEDQDVFIKMVKEMAGYSDDDRRDHLLYNYNSVNDEGKQKIVEYSEDIASNEKYQRVKEAIDE